MSMGNCRLRALVLAVASLATIPLLSSAQNSLDPGNASAAVPEITFEFNWKVADPQWFQVTVSQDGKTTYESRAGGDNAGSEPYSLRFVMSEPTRTRIFATAKALNDFKGNFESRTKVAQTGTKTLVFRQGSTENKTTLNYSDNRQMNELIELFQKMSTTFELAQRLDYDMRFDRLGLDRDLKTLVRLDSDKQLAELQVIAPTLERIANDPEVMNIARDKARKLLERSRPVIGQR